MRFFQKSKQDKDAETASILDDVTEMKMEVSGASRPLSAPTSYGHTPQAPTSGAISFAAPSQPTPLSRPVENDNRTRLVGFDTSDGRTSLFEGDDGGSKQAQGAFEPVGWLVVAKGPGRGNSFSLRAGLSTIGRGTDQTITLDYGDQAISRSNHAAIVYEPDTHRFHLGHGGKANIVRVNGKPLVSTEELVDGSAIEIGDTTLRFVALCTNDFNWSEDTTGSVKGDDDAAFL